MKFKQIFRRFSRYSVIALATIVLLLTVLPVISIANDPMLFIDFEDGTDGGFDVRGTEKERENNGTGILHVSKDVARSGDYSLLITDRNRAWNGIAFDLLPHIEPDITYEITFWVHAKTPDSSEFVLSTQIGTGGEASYNNLIKKNISVSSGWVEMTDEYTYSQANIDSGHITVYIENNTSDAEFYIDDFSLTVLGGGIAWDPLTDPITRNKIDTFMDFDYEFWSERRDDDAKMQLTGPGTFWCNWERVHNILFRTGKKLGSIMSVEDYGDIIIDYKASHYISGGSVSYLTAYGWTQDPLVEWYVIEQHGSYKPGSEHLDTVEIDGALYEIRIDTRVQQPSIEGTQTFLQVFSIRKEHRTEGVITLSDHFKAWEELGLNVGGNLYEVSMCIEGFSSSGSGSISKLALTIGDDVFVGESLQPPPEPTTPKPPEDDPKPEPTPDGDFDPTPVPSEPTPTPSDTGGSGFPEWAIYIIIGGAAAVALVIVMITKKKKA